MGGDGSIDGVWVERIVVGVMMVENLIIQMERWREHCRWWMERVASMVVDGEGSIDSVWRG